MVAASRWRWALLIKFIMDSRIVYRSRVDWWVWVVMAVFLGIVWFSAFGMPWFYVAFVGGGMTLLCVLLMFGCRYEIVGEDLVIYQFFYPTRLPIRGISMVKKSSGYLTTAGMSHLRVSIYFSDRSVMKSAMPVIISPADRDGFIKKLCEIHPSIEVSDEH